MVDRSASGYAVRVIQEFCRYSKMHYNQLVEEELKQKAGEKYEREKPYSRWGSNPGSIRIGEEKVLVEAQEYIIRKTVE